MIINLLRSKNFPGHLSLLLLIAACSWFPLFTEGVVVTVGAGSPVFQLITGLLEQWPEWVKIALIIGVQIVLLFIVAWQIAKLHLLRGRVIISVFVFFLGINYIPEAVSISPQLLSLPLIIPALSTFLIAPEGKNQNLKIFNAGFFAGIAILIYLPLILFIVFALFAFIILRIYSLRTWAVFIAAILIPSAYLLFFAWFFGSIDWLQGVVNEIPQIIPTSSHLLEVFKEIKPDIFESFSIILFISIFVFSFIRIIFRLSERVILERRYFRGLTIFFLLMFFGIIFSNGLPFQHLILITFITSVFVGEYLLELKRTRLVDIFLILLILSVSLSRFNLFG